MTEVILPPGVTVPDRVEAPEQVVIDNRTDLPDNVITEAVRDSFVEHASLNGIERTTFQTYAAEGSLLARRRYQVPSNVIDEMRLARDLAERDDDVAAVIGEMCAIAFADGFEQQGDDEATVELFCEMAKPQATGLDHVLQEMYRELLITSQVSTATLFTRENLSYTLQGVKRRLNKNVAVPLIGVLHAENIRIVGNDLFRTGQLAYVPDSDRLRAWLSKYFDPGTDPAIKAEMGRKDRVSANLFTGRVPTAMANEDAGVMSGSRWGANELYFLNERMVHRSTFPKGQWKYARPLLTRDFSLLEAKRLLNILDYALLQGGSNFIVVAKKGSDQRPAQKDEIENLQQVVRVASKTGVIVGDHRLSFEVLTPKMEALLDPSKRRLIGRKIVQAMLRIPESAQETPPRSTQANPELESKTRVITSDRRLIKNHVEGYIYPEVIRRNPSIFTEAPCLAFPKIVLQGTEFFTDYMLKLRDRGDIPRKWAVEYAGFDFDAAVDQRKLELASGADEVLQPAFVPNSNQSTGPQDNNEGRPKGAGDGSRPDPFAPSHTILKTPGETVKSWYEEEADAVYRMGEVTYAILEEHPDRNVGYVTRTERVVLEEAGEEAIQKGSTLYMPVNPGYSITGAKSVRLRPGVSLIVGKRKGDGAIVAKLLCFRDAEMTAVEAEDQALKWGFDVKMPQPQLPTPE